MAGTRVPYIFIEGTTALASEVVANFDHITSTNDQLMGTPRTAAWNMAGYELILDADGDTSITADTDDRIDIRIGAVDLFRFDGTAADCDSGIDFVASDLSGGNGVPSLTIVSTETDCDLNMIPKGAGDLQVNGGSMSPLAWQVYGA